MSIHLDALEAQTIYILREAYNRIDNLAMLWSIGKDSTALLWMARKAFFGEVPFPLVHLDTEMELPEVYDFRDSLQKDWGFTLQSEMCPPEENMDQSLPPATRAAARKTEGLKQLDRYLSGLGLLNGWLVIFDHREGVPPISERTISEMVISPQGRSITVIRA